MFLFLKYSAAVLLGSQAIDLLTLSCWTRDPYIYYLIDENNAHIFGILEVSLEKGKSARIKTVQMHNHRISGGEGC